MQIENLSKIKPILINLVWQAIILFVVLFMVRSALAQEATPVAPGEIILQEPTPVVAARKINVTDDQVNAIAKQMFCPVCENIPLDVCPTQACAQWRELIREKLAIGWNEKQIKDYFVEQYGERVLGAPPARGINWLVYVVPPLAILGGIFFLQKGLRSWKSEARQDSVAGLQAVPEAGDQDSDGKANEYVQRLEEELRNRERE